MEAAARPPKTPSFNAILEDPEASQAFDNLARDGCTRQELEDELALLLFVAKLPRGIAQGKSAKQVKDFPGQVVRFAEEIEKYHDKAGFLYELMILARVERGAGHYVTLGRPPFSNSTFSVAELLLRNPLTTGNIRSRTLHIVQSPNGGTCIARPKRST